jgi:ADP-ribose pyrophosphatase
MSAKVNHRTPIYRARVFRLVKENITLDNGVTTDLEYVEHPGAAAIVPLIRPDEVILIKQYRHALKQYIWEIPAGTLDPKETVIDCARRELAEETGYAADAWQKLAEITPVPGYSDERIHLFLAEGLKAARQSLDADEVLAVHRVALSRAVEMIAQGDIQDAKSICGLLLADRWLSLHPQGRNTREGSGDAGKQASGRRRRV